MCLFCIEIGASRPADRGVHCDPNLRLAGFPLNLAILSSVCTKRSVLHVTVIGDRQNAFSVCSKYRPPGGLDADMPMRSVAG